jgi:hypothetical protein
MRQADIDDGTKPGESTAESAELRDARRRIKLLEQDNDVLRRRQCGHGELCRPAAEERARSPPLEHPSLEPNR